VCAGTERLKKLIKKAAVIGAGSWGTTLASLLANQKHLVYLWTHSPTHIPETQAHISDSLENVLQDCELVILAVASNFYRDTVQKVIKLMPKDAYILSATKGLEIGTGKRMSEILIESLPAEQRSRAAILSGPNLAREIAEHKPAAAVVASTSQETAHYFQKLFSTNTFRIYTSQDVIGVELGGTLKNIIAIAAGIADGYKFGSNAKAALMVRGLAEIVRLGTALGAKPATFYGLSGMGDLITTCSSNLSRNFQLGQSLAAGEKVSNVEVRMLEVAEGIKTTKVAYELAKKLQVEMPITEQIYDVIVNQKDPYEAVTKLMLRDLKAES
jgi:glycerol-3-phosphate dehydrogenase (NAD(P)+)